jgi:hypothetical protein
VQDLLCVPFPCRIMCQLIICRHSWRSWNLKWKVATVSCGCALRFMVQGVLVLAKIRKECLLLCFLFVGFTLVCFAHQTLICFVFTCRRNLNN